MWPIILFLLIFLGITDEFYLYYANVKEIHDYLFLYKNSRFCVCVCFWPASKPLDPNFVSIELKIPGKKLVVDDPLSVKDLIIEKVISNYLKNNIFYWPCASIRFHRAFGAKIPSGTLWSQQYCCRRNGVGFLDIRS